MTPQLRDGGLVIANSGGPDALGTVEQLRHWNADNPWLKDAVLIRLSPACRQWMLRTEVRPAEQEDLRQVYGQTFSAWQIALWRALLYAGAEPFTAAAIATLRPLWADGWTVEAVFRQLAPEGVEMTTPRPLTRTRTGR